MSILNKNIFILTGAGISKESGINTFREEDGLWDNFKIEDTQMNSFGILDGKINHDRLKDWFLDFQISSTYLDINESTSLMDSKFPFAYESASPNNSANKSFSLFAFRT